MLSYIYIYMSIYIYIYRNMQQLDQEASINKGFAMEMT